MIVRDTVYMYANALLQLCNFWIFPLFRSQDALDVAQPGDTIELTEGHYWEHLITVVRTW